MRARHASGRLIAVALGVASCRHVEAEPIAVDAAAPEVVASADASIAPPPAAGLAQLFRDLSEPDRDFLSDNLVSNETSYLQVAAALRTRARKDGAYVGVGPEQNFTYVAITEPRVAFIVDIRRANAIEHLWYKALFDMARGRAHFLALLFGQPFVDSDAPGADATIDQLVEFASTRHADERTREATAARARELVENVYAVKLDASDVSSLDRISRVFFDKALALTFEMHEKSWRRFPTLASLLAQRSPQGDAAGFLASEPAFRKVQRMERENRIVPIVGDFAGDRALPGVAAELLARGLTVSVFYVSNVEQYVVGDAAKWRAWVRNVRALPSDETSLFVRCHLDQGRAHPRQMHEHRTTTVLQTFARFESRAYANFWQLATDDD